MSLSTSASFKLTALIAVAHCSSAEHIDMLQEELAYLKALWDMVGAVMFTFTDWYATLWDKIDVDFLVEETKKLTKDIKQLNKAVRNYEVYRWVQAVATSASTSASIP